jgi:arylsulfatase A-like enzyme
MRVNMQKKLVSGIGIVFLLFASGCQKAEEEKEVAQEVEKQVETRAKRPNILLIVADDMGYSDIGAFGGEVATPTLDALAHEALRLSNFHVLPSCSPTRSVLLSGVDNHLAGMGTMGEFKTPEMDDHPGYAGYLNFEVAALPEVLRAGGYHTYMAGKWHLGDEPETRPHARGFEETFALMPGGGSHWSDRRPLSPPQTMNYSRNGEFVESLPDDFYSTRFYTDTLLRFLEDDQGDDSPFFAYLSYTASHDPLHAPKEYIEKYKGVYDSGWDDLRQRRLEALVELGIVPADTNPFPRIASVSAWSDLSPEEQANSARDMEVYAAMLDYMDEQILRVFDYLKGIGEYDNTMVIFFSDNGANGAVRMAYPGQTEEFLESFDNSLENRGLINSYVEMGPGWAQASMAPGRMFKGFTSEGGIRSPMIVKLPGTMSNAGSITKEFVHVRDIMPTILDIAGVSHPEEFDGHTVRPMQGQSVLEFVAGGVTVPYVGAAQVGYELFGLKAFFDGNWKILNMPPPFASGEWELYNLAVDPGETNNLSEVHPERVADMVESWEQYKENNAVLDASMDLSRAFE